MLNHFKSKICKHNFDIQIKIMYNEKVMYAKEGKIMEEMVQAMD